MAITSDKKESPLSFTKGHLNACVINLGCRVNRVESDWIEKGFEALNVGLVAEQDADIIAINTCAVTGEAEAKTRKAVRRACESPHCSLVAVTGCVASLFPQELEALSPKVVVMPSKITLAEDAVTKFHALIEGETSSMSASYLKYNYKDEPYDLSHNTNLNVDDEGRTISSSASLSAAARIKRGIKVQDGCDNRCTYCIVWKARGTSHSIDLAHIKDQVATAIRDGAAEIDLTGVNLGRFRAIDEQGKLVDLAGLLNLVANMARGKVMVRASSLEPQDIDEAVLQAMANNHDVICSHLHLPIQSGSDATLKRMARPYTSSDFAHLVQRARELMPDFSLTTDVIVGFPGETDQDFEDSLNFCRDIGFSKMHVFRYSVRPGTIAATMPNQIDPQVAAARSKRMRAVADDLRRQDAQSRITSTVRAVIERVDNNGCGYGTTDSFHRVKVVASDPSRPCELGYARVYLSDYDEAADTLIGQLDGYVRVVQPRI